MLGKTLANVAKKSTQSQLSDLFRNPKFLSSMKQHLGLLPSIFSDDKLEYFIKHKSCRDYLSQAFTSKSKSQSKPLSQTSSKIYSQLAQSKQNVEAYLNFMMNECPRDVITSRQLIEMCDMRSPENWYGDARKSQRKIIYHHGPTNSGKTSAAIDALKNAKSGIYMAPLRLLAWQTQQRLLPCTLITGQEKEIMNSGLTSCTIQTADLGIEYDVAVIDEVQLISDQSRGWAWTQALLGVRAKELHLCGENRALGLIHKVIKLTADLLEEKKYNRFSKLHLVHKPFDIETDLLPGDCIIGFSSKTLYKLRSQINKLYCKPDQNKVAIVYGKLPPESRKTQANLFNEGTLPYLVATNAIGMGLNLKIRRIIFSSVSKMNDQGTFKILKANEIQQIAGRAGRGITDGYVQAVHHQDLKIIRKALKRLEVAYGLPLSEEKEQEKQGPLGPNEKEQVIVLQSENYSEHLKRHLSTDQTDIDAAAVYCFFFSLQRFMVGLESLTRKKLRMSQVFEIYMKSSQRQGWCFIQQYADFCEQADKVQNLKLTVRDQYNFAKAPLSGGPTSLEQLRQFAQFYQYDKQVQIPRYILQNYKNKFTFNYKDQRSVNALQAIYQHIEIYIWLASKFQLAFKQLQLAITIRACISDRISTILNMKNSNPPIDN